MVVDRKEVSSPIVKVPTRVKVGVGVVGDDCDVVVVSAAHSFECLPILNRDPAHLSASTCLLRNFAHRCTRLLVPSMSKVARRV